MPTLLYHLESIGQQAEHRGRIGNHVLLRRAGKELAGLCPFHPDKTPSLTVSEDKGLFLCFGCGAKGDVIDFVMQLDGIGFREAKAALGMVDELKVRPAVRQSNGKPRSWRRHGWLSSGARSTYC